MIYFTCRFWVAADCIKTYDLADNRKKFIRIFLWGGGLSSLLRGERGALLIVIIVQNQSNEIRRFVNSAL